MLWRAAEHVRDSRFASAADPAILGIDRDLGAALLCGLAALGLMVPRARGAVAVAIVLGATYALSAARLAGTLGAGALGLVAIIAAALVLAWPRLVARDG
jgi:hypothetical protein